jgi:hypothetical protein
VVRFSFALLEFTRDELDDDGDAYVERVAAHAASSLQHAARKVLTEAQKRVLPLQCAIMHLWRQEQTPVAGSGGGGVSDLAFTRTQVWQSLDVLCFSHITSHQVRACLLFFFLNEFNGDVVCVLHGL